MVRTQRSPGVFADPGAVSSGAPAPGALTSGVLTSGVLTSGALTSSALSEVATQLYDDYRLNPMLTQLIRTTCGLAHTMGGSVSLVDGLQGHYTKVAEIGTACRLGQSFPLSEGVTGQVLRHRGPVVLGAYRQLSTGHLKAGPAADGAVAAVPIWWRAEIVAVNVVFAGERRTFSAGEVDQLELVTQVVAAGLVSAVKRERPDAGLGASKGPDRAAAGPPAPSVHDVVAGLMDLAQRVSPVEQPPGGLQVRVLGDARQARLLFRAEPDPGAGTRSDPPWQELVDGAGGAVEVRSSDPVLSDADPDRRNPFSAREKQVASLLARGLSDRAIAQELFLSPKTVEKHVSAVLRKTGTSSRTAAAVRCLELGWS